MSKEMELPGGWVWTTLDEIVAPTRISVQPGGCPTLPYIGLEHIEAETMKLLGTTPSSTLKSNAIRFGPGDVLYGRLRPYLNKVFRPDFEGLCSPELLVFRETSILDSHYLQYFLNSWNFKAFASHLVEGDRPRVDWDQLKVFNFPLAPLTEQHCIVEVIEQQLTELDAAVTSLRQDTEKLKLARAATLKYAVEGKLTEQWLTEHPTTESASELLERILQERRAKWEADELVKMAKRGIVPKDDKWKEKYKEPVEPDTMELSELPDGWCWAVVEQISQIQGGLQKQPSRAPKKNAFPYLRVANVFRGRLDLSVIEKMELFGHELDTLRLEIGDLLIVEGNGSRNEIGRSALWQDEISNCVHQNHIIRVRSIHVSPKYLDYYWNSPTGSNKVMDVAASTSGLYTLSVGKIAKLPVPLPPLHEQQQIVAEVERRLSVIAQAEAALDLSLKRAKSARQSILEKAFAGKLVPQDPNDEPASVLLERIREERKKREQEGLQRGKNGHIHTNANNTKRGRATKRDKRALYEVPLDVQQPLTSEALLQEAGLQAAKVDHANGFGETLSEEVKAQRIKELRSTYQLVLLEATPDEA